MSDLGRALKDALEKKFAELEGDKEAKPRPSAPELAVQLRTAFEVFSQKNCFQAGDLITWKEGMSDKHVPRVGEPAIVLEVLDKPYPNTPIKGGAHYDCARLDLVVGVIDNEGDFLHYHVDSRRFQIFDQSI